MKEGASIRDYDWWLLATAFAICGIGVLEIWSATHASRLAGMHTQQIYWVALGFVLMLLISRLDYHTIMDQAPVLYIIAIIALVLAYFVGWIIAHGFAINLWVMHRGDDHDSCESPMLAIWLGVTGIVGIIVAVFWIMFVLMLGSIVNWGRFVGERQSVQLTIGYYAGIAITLICVCVLGLFMFAWQITGSVWTYRIDRYNHKCPNDMYNFAFWYITIAWVSGVILYLILVILIVIGASTTASKARTDDSV